jgi:hypothetical protein
MFARKVSVRLKPNSISEFTNLMDREVLPWLQKQEGFLDLIILAGTDSQEVTTISFWDHLGNAEIHNSYGYPDVLKVLAGLLDGAPYVKTFEVVRSTVHPVVLASEPERGDLADTDSAGSGYRSYETNA